MPTIMFLTYFKIARKNIVKAKVLNIINILGLAIGISACLAIWSILRFELSYNNFQPGGDRIYRLVSEMHQNNGDIRYNGSVPLPTLEQVTKEIPGIETIGGFVNYNATVTIPETSGDSKQFPKAPDGQNNDDLILVTPGYFDLFHYQWLVGNPVSALTEPYQVVLSAKQAFKYFGSSDWQSLIGKEIIYDGKLKTRVSGIVKDMEGNTDFSFTDFISFSSIQSSYLENDLQPSNWGWIMSTNQIFVKLEKGVSPAKFAEQLRAFGDRRYQIGPGEIARLQPLSDLHYSEHYEMDYGRHTNLNILYGLLGIAALILIIAAINFINLSLAQSLQRVKEIGIRKVLGSSRAGLVMQFLAETLLMCVLALLVSIAIIKPLFSAFPSFVPSGVSLNILEPGTIVFVVLLLAATTLLAGLYPGWVLSSFQPANALKSKAGIKGGFRDNFRKGLIVFQFAISLVFIISSIIIGDQIHFLLKKDMGFKQDAIITLNTNGSDSLYKKQSFAERISTLSGIDKVSIHDFPPATSGTPTVGCTYAGPVPINIGANFRFADENYLPLYQIQLLAGRNFFPGDTLRAFIINQTCARMLGFQHPEDAIGKVIGMGFPGAPPNNNHPVIGVVADFNAQPLRRSIKPMLIESIPASENGFSVKLRTQGKSVAEFTEAMDKIQKIWKETFPGQAFDYHFYDDTIASFYSKEQKTSQLVYLGMIIAIFLSCIGLFGLAALTAETRRKEIGIRKVMGAGTARLVYLMVKDFQLLVLLSFIIASPIAWLFTNKWLQNYAYRISVSWWIFALACTSTVLISFLTVGYHVFKAAMANPVKMLRSE